MLKKLTIEVHTIDGLVTLLSTPGLRVDLSTLTPQTLTPLTREKAKSSRSLPSGHLIYAKSSRSHKPVIDIKRTLSHHNMSITDITLNSWRVGTWQNSLKRAIVRSH